MSFAFGWRSWPPVLPISIAKASCIGTCHVFFPLSLRRLTLHSDIKPDNILLDAQGHAALSDLNIAMHYSRSRLHTSVAGSMPYMAPEVVDPRRPGYSWQVDWWSLGVCAFELLWNKRPFDGNSADSMRDSIMTHPIRKPSQRYGPVSGDCLSAIFGVSRDRMVIISRLMMACPTLASRA
jgi:serine/threonine protein kinase